MVEGQKVLSRKLQAGIKRLARENPDLLGAVEATLRFREAKSANPHDKGGSITRRIIEHDLPRYEYHQPVGQPLSPEFIQQLADESQNPKRGDVGALRRQLRARGITPSRATTEDIDRVLTNGARGVVDNKEVGLSGDPF